jgi:hypothetical protein
MFARPNMLDLYRLGLAWFPDLWAFGSGMGA